MPLPNPKNGQNKNDYISSCMGDQTMNKEFPDKKQRAAVCYSKWEEATGEIEVDFSDQIVEAKEKKTLNKPFRTPKGPKKFSVYVKNDKGNVVKVNFGDPNMEIKRDDPERRKNFRARHNCDNPGPKWKARYWSCRQWRSGKKVEGAEDFEYEWDGETLFNESELLALNPSLAEAEEIFECDDWDCEECYSKKGLWDNIRDKKKREGKNYRPAKPGDKDRPDEKSWKKAQKPKKK